MKAAQRNTLRRGCEKLNHTYTLASKGMIGLDGSNYRGRLRPVVLQYRYCDLGGC